MQLLGIIYFKYLYHLIFYFFPFIIVDYLAFIPPPLYSQFKLEVSVCIIVIFIKTFFTSLLVQVVFFDLLIASFKKILLLLYFLK